MRRAREAFTTVKNGGPRNAKAEGVGEAWLKDVKNVLASCVALGVAIAGVKSKVGGLAAGGVEGLGVRAEIPEMGKRYAEGWIVGKVVKL